MRQVNFCTAVSRGNPSRSAACCHGSTFCRANAESTVTSNPFLSSPIGEYKNSLNSEGTEDREAVGVIAILVDASHGLVGAVSYRLGKFTHRDSANSSKSRWFHRHPSVSHDYKRGSAFSRCASRGQ